jgi:hypothetical protein
MRRFRGYRPHAPKHYYEQGVANAPDAVQYEGVVFSDGTVCVRWVTESRSHSIWENFATFLRIHGHPEYGTVIEWLDGPAEDAPPNQGQSTPGARPSPLRADTLEVDLPRTAPPSSKPGPQDVRVAMGATTPRARTVPRRVR